MSVRTKCFTLIFLIALYRSLFLPAADGQATPSGKKLEVFILAVTQFDDHSWDNPALQTSIEKSAQDLVDFFAHKFASADVHLLSSRNDTTHDSLVTFLRGDFHNLANGTVSLVFVLSHGVPSKSANPNFNQDLLIATSDTNKKQPALKGLSVAKDVVPEFAGLDRPGSIVIAFLDTCYSGSASSLNMRILSAVAANYGLRMMIMASSLSETQTYRASFTEALLSLWKTPSTGAICTTPELAPDKLRGRIKNLLAPDSLGAAEGLPKVVIPYDGKLCLESFASDSGLIVFFNALPAPPPLAAIIKMRGQPIDDSLPLETNNVVPYKVAREKYTVQVVQNDFTQVFEDEIDLAADPVAFETIGAPKPAQLSDIYVKTANYIAAAGLPKEHADSYKQRAFASLIAQEKYSLAYRLVPEIGKVDADWHRATDLGSEHRFWSDAHGKGKDWRFTADGRLGETESERQLESQIGTAQLAKVEKLAGDFAMAARLYEKSTLAADSEPERTKFAKQAYFAYGASDQPEEARRARLKLGVQLEIICPTCIQKEQAAIREASPKTIEEFEVLCIVQALAHIEY